MTEDEALNPEVALFSIDFHLVTAPSFYLFVQNHQSMFSKTHQIDLAEHEDHNKNFTNLWTKLCAYTFFQHTLPL